MMVFLLAPTARLTAVAALLIATLAGPGCSKSPSTTKPKADVAFLVSSCIDTGFGESPCQCVGDQAKTALSAQLIDKIRNAPSDDDLAAVEAYYTGAEVQTIVTFLRAASKACKIGEPS